MRNLGGGIGANELLVIELVLSSKKTYFAIAGNLESNSSDSEKWNRNYDLFYLPEGKGTGNLGVA